MYRKAAIRPFRRQDEPVLFDLAWRTYGQTPGWQERYTLEVLEHDVVFVAEVEGQPAGYEALARGREAVRIDQLLVSAHHDDEGIEEQLVAYAEGYAISVGAAVLEAVVEPDNSSAVTFYRQCGFAQAGPGIVRLVLPQQ
jgi:ribosomal protein S18 acetylase RimI-like enzyme